MVNSFWSVGRRSLLQVALPDHQPPPSFLPPSSSLLSFCLWTHLPLHPQEAAAGPPAATPPPLTTSWALLCSSRAWAACCCRYRSSCCRRKRCWEKSCSCWAWCRGPRPGGYRAAQSGGAAARSISSARGRTHSETAPAAQPPVSPLGVEQGWAGLGRASLCARLPSPGDKGPAYTPGVALTSQRQHANMGTPSLPPPTPSGLPSGIPEGWEVPGWGVQAPEKRACTGSG